jgi:trehalose-6-phosphate synthase
MQEALIVNPYDVEEMANAIKTALDTLAIPTSPSEAARKALQDIELARVSPRMRPN